MNSRHGLIYISAGYQSITASTLRHLLIASRQQQQLLQQSAQTSPYYIKQRITGAFFPWDVRACLLNARTELCILNVSQHSNYEI
jgi:hypothetical protein